MKLRIGPEACFENASYTIENAENGKFLMKSQFIPGDDYVMDEHDLVQFMRNMLAWPECI